MESRNFAYTTLVTRPSYLAGVVILAYSLKRQGSRYPLVVLYTDSLPQPCVAALEDEAEKLNIRLLHTEALLPSKDLEISLIAERFADTWTKLRVFELFQYERVCYLDADMMIFHDMDTIFDVKLPSDDWLAATPICCCNLDKDPWAPDDWVAANCAFTDQHHPAALSTHVDTSDETVPTRKMLNGGTFLFQPSQDLWKRVLHMFDHDRRLAEYKFPDQDFLADFFRDRWVSISWKYNALKTMRYWHPNIWRDDDVVCLHYIVDKPWAKRIKNDGVAGYLGRDGVTHSWWWREFNDFESKLQRRGQTNMLGVLQKYMAKPLSGNDNEDGDINEELSAVGANVQGFARNSKDKSQT